MRDFTGNQWRETKTGIKSSGTNICPGSEANVRSFANCLAVIVEADSSSRGDMIFFILSFGKLLTNYNWKCDISYVQLGADDQGFRFISIHKS